MEELSSGGYLSKAHWFSLMLNFVNFIYFLNESFQNHMRMQEQMCTREPNLLTFSS